MINKISEIAFLGVLIILILVCLIMLFLKTQNILQIGINILIIIIILGTGIGTYFLGNKINMISLISIVLLSLIFLSIYMLLSNNIENYENYDDIDENELENKLHTEIEQAQSSCLRINILEEELKKYQDDNTNTNFIQGPCILADGSYGNIQINTGNVCVPFKTTSANLENNATMTSGSDGNILNNEESEEESEENYSIYGNSDKEDDDDENDENTITTSCYNYNTPLDNICKSIARQNNKTNFQLFGVKKYKKCDNNKRKAVCKKYYNNGLPTNQTNMTECIDSNLQNLNYKFASECKQLGDMQNQDLIPINMGVYNCEFGKVRSMCIARNLYKDIKNENNFYNNIYA